MNQQPNWPVEAREAMEKFIVHLREELGEGATIADIEQAVLDHYQELLSDVVQALVNDQGTFPPGATRP